MRLEAWDGIPSSDAIDHQGKAMTRMTLITPSFAPDFDLCVDLRRSVLDNAPDSASHQIIVYREDLKLFDRLAGPRTHIQCKADFLPTSFVVVPFTDFAINLRRPFPPVRGWILQQVVKLAAVAASECDVVVVVDSDVEFIKPFAVETFARDGCVRFYRKPNGVDERLPRHVIWHRTARALLGLPPAEPPYPDYIASLLAWDPKIVRQMLDHVVAVTGRPWPTAIAGQLHFSESTLYGVFVDNVLGAPANSFVSDDPLCHPHYTTPLTGETAGKFLCDLKHSDIAFMISAKSRTPLDVRRQALAAHKLAQNPNVRLEAGT